MFFLIESFDVFSNTVNSSCDLYKSLNEINFFKVRFLGFFLVIYAILIFYISVKNIKNNFLFSIFLNGFNQNLKNTLFFKKINFLN